MPKHEKRVPRFASNCLRPCLLTVTAFVTMSLATTTFANPSNGHHGPKLSFRGLMAMALEVPRAKPYDIAETLVSVANVEGLYAAVNDPTNSGAVIVLAPGIYALSANGPATCRALTADGSSFKRTCLSTAWQAIGPPL